MLKSISFLAASVGILVSCGINRGEASCMGKVDLLEDAQLIQCRKDHGGKCPEAKIDRIMNANDAASRDCIRNN